MSWYKGKIPKEWILTIHLTPLVPEERAEEQWFSEEVQADCIRCGSRLYLIGAKIPLLPAMFRGFLSLREIEGIQHLDLSAARDLSAVFEDCASLRELDLNHWDVSQVTNFSRLFKGCRSLRVLRIDAWNTASAENLRELCSGCIRLEEIDLSHWKLGRVRDLSALFLECNRLENLDVSQWDVSEVRDFSRTFACCYQLKALDVSRWNTQAAESMDCLFSRCKTLKNLDVSAWNTKQAANFRKLFYGCQKLKMLDLRAWHFGEAAVCDSMFLGVKGRLKLPRDRSFTTLAPGDSWFRKGLRPAELRYISSIHIQKKSRDPEWFNRRWAADCRNSGVLTAYKKGEELLLNCRNKVLYSNENSIRAFSIPDEDGRSWISQISGLELLNSRYTKDFRLMFAGNSLLPKPEDSLFDFRSAEETAWMFEGCRQTAVVIPLPLKQ